VAEVTHLRTVVDLDDTVVPDEVRDAPMLDAPPPAGFEPGSAPTGSGPPVDDPHRMSLSALHLAVLDDGRRVTLLDDRGWSASGPGDIWRRTTIAEMEAEARTVVGPDEPCADRSPADMAADHWAQLAGILQQQGVHVEAGALGRLPHEVELSPRVQARLGRR
jgi:hypothetical protein